MGVVLLKLLYSALLLGLSSVLLRELWTVWFDPKIYIGRFEVVSETAKDEEAEAAFANRIVSAQAMMSRQLMDYQTRSGTDTPTDFTYLLTRTVPLSLPPNAFEEIDITIQDVNLSQLLTVVRKGFLAPNEVKGHVTMREGSVLTAVDWPRAPKPADGQEPLSQFLTPSKANEQEAAVYVACSISWIRAASLNPEIAKLPRAQFCDFATALDDLYALSSKASQPGGLSKDEATLVRARVAQLRAHYGSNKVFAELYRLRADLLDLLPEGVLTRSDLVESQEDRVRYAMLSPELRDLPQEEARPAALALARPAILLEEGVPLELPKNWNELLSRHEAAIQAAATSTGLIIRNDGYGTGFIVGPGLVMTTSFVLNDARSKLSLCLGSSATGCKTVLEIGDVVYQNEESQIVIAKLVGHDPDRYPPLPLAAPLPDANTIIGRYSFVVGYAFGDYRMPEQFKRRLLGEKEGFKRLMPGRILDLGSDGPLGVVNPESKRAPIFTTDISTSAGTAGGPLVDLTTGAVIGVSYAGIWKGERGKFAYAESIPNAALGIIDPQLRGQIDNPSRTPASNTPSEGAESSR